MYMAFLHQVSQLLIGKRGVHGGFWVVLGLVITLIGGVTRGADISEAEVQNRKCTGCHGQSNIAEFPPEVRRQQVDASALSGPQPATRPELYITQEKLKGSVH